MGVRGLFVCVQPAGLPLPFRPCILPAWLPCLLAPLPPSHHPAATCPPSSVQEVPRHSWLRRGVGAPPNRYGIKPGRHWDGVDRGNGFEREMFKRQNELKRQAQEAYMWSQEDM